MAFCTKKTVLEIGKIEVNITEWTYTENTLDFEWIEIAQPPNFDNEYSEEIDREKAIAIVKVLTKHFDLSNET